MRPIARAQPAGTRSTHHTPQAPEACVLLGQEQWSPRKRRRWAWKAGRVAAARLVDAMAADGGVGSAEPPKDCPQQAWDAARALAARICAGVDVRRALCLGAHASDAPAGGDADDADGQQPPCPDTDLAVAVLVASRVLQVGSN